MLLLRRFLIWIRLQYTKDPRAFLIKFGAITAALFVIDVLVDSLVPFGGPYGVYMLLRSLLLIPTILSVFTLGYALSIFGHRTQMENNPRWVAYRARYSPMWRRRIAIIGAAVLLVLVVGSNQGPVYTVSSSLIGAAALALVSFIRMTKEEVEREEFGVPDPRDLAWKTRTKYAEAKRATKKRKAQSDAD